MHLRYQTKKGHDMRLAITAVLAKLLGVTFYVDGARRGARESHGITD